MSIWTDLSRTSFKVVYIDVDGWRTRVLIAGSGPALVMMHGTGGHLEAYSRNIAALAEQNTVIAYDLPGHGYSAGATADLEIDGYVRHLASLLDELGIESASLSGESLGGWIAIKFAYAHRDRVDRLILNTPGGTMASPEVMERIRALTQAAVNDPTEGNIRRRLEWLMADPRSVTEELLQSRAAIYAQPHFAESIRHVLCLQNPDIRRHNLVTDNVLEAIDAPALVVWTSDDPSGPATEGQQIAKTLPLGEYLFIDHAGHWPQWEQPEIFNAAVLEFVGRDRA